MVFMKLNNFFYSQYQFDNIKIYNLDYKKNAKYHIYTINNTLRYTSISKDLFDINDELLIIKSKEKIILFKNLSKNKNNFKELNMKYFCSLFVSFIAFVLFGFFYYKSNSNIDLFFLIVFLSIFLFYIYNFILLKKQIVLIDK